MITYNEFLLEKEQDGAVFTFMRANPITIGHEENINYVINLAKKENYKALLYTSFSHDNKKNPLSPSSKIKYLKSCFNIEVNEDKSLNNAFKVLEELAKKYKNIIFVIGEDRVQDFKTMYKYAEQWDVQDFSIVQSGTRTEGVSGTKMREFIKNNDFDSFTKYLPRSCKIHAIDIFNEVKENLK